MRIGANIVCVVVAVALVSRVMAGETGATDVASSDFTGRVRQVQASVEKIEAMLAYLTQLQQSTTNSEARQQCVEMQLAKLIGLNELAHKAQTRFADAKPEDDAFELTAAQIVSAAERAEKIVVDVEFCSKTFKAMKNGKPSPMKTPPYPVSPAKTSTNAVTQAFIYPPSRPYVARKEQDCLTQGKLACLLVKVFDLGDGRSTAASVSALESKGIEPLDGWKPEKAADLDDLCVAVGRALKIHVTSQNEALSYDEALRLEGFPVGECFPGHSFNDAPPLLLETEVRRFLATGIGAPPSL